MSEQKYCRIIALTIMIAGLFLAGWGISMSAFSDFAKSRYEQSTGKFLRSFSKKDESYYHALSMVSGAGKAMSGIGLLIILAGTYCMMRPAIVIKFLNPNKDTHV